MGCRNVIYTPSVDEDWRYSADWHTVFTLTLYDHLMRHPAITKTVSPSGQTLGRLRNVDNVTDRKYTLGRGLAALAEIARWRAWWRAVRLVQKEIDARSGELCIHTLCITLCNKAYLLNIPNDTFKILLQQSLAAQQLDEENVTPDGLTWLKNCLPGVFFPSLTLDQAQRVDGLMPGNCLTKEIH